MFPHVAIVLFRYLHTSAASVVALGLGISYSAIAKGMCGFHVSLRTNTVIFNELRPFSYIYLR
jgi:hypothetical protein